MSNDDFYNYYMNYKNAYSILGKYSLLGLESDILLEIRKSGKLGCEIYTTIKDITYNVSSGLLKGCLKKLLLELPEGSSIILPHQVHVRDQNGQVSKMVVKENIFNHLKEDSLSIDIDTNITLVLLSFVTNGEEFYTSPYDYDDISSALDDIKKELEKKYSLTIQICQQCQFLEDYANTMICLRDLNSNELESAKVLRKARKSLSGYYEKIAWDIEDFHYCSAFTSRKK